MWICHIRTANHFTAAIYFHNIYCQPEKETSTNDNTRLSKIILDTVFSFEARYNDQRAVFPSSTARVMEMQCVSCQTELNL
jgi:hypothetical protein